MRKHCQLVTRQRPACAQTNFQIKLDFIYQSIANGIEYWLLWSGNILPR